MKKSTKSQNVQVTTVGPSQGQKKRKGPRSRVGVLGSKTRVTHHTSCVYNQSINARERESILVFRLRVGVAGIACVAIGITFAGVVGILDDLLLGCLACLDGLHLPGNGV